MGIGIAPAFNGMTKSLRLYVRVRFRIDKLRGLGRIS